MGWWEQTNDGLWLRRDYPRPIRTTHPRLINRLTIDFCDGRIVHMKARMPLSCAQSPIDGFYPGDLDRHAKSVF